MEEICQVISVSSRRQPQILALTALLGGLVLPFVGKPVHVDDANFLALARGARLDAWRPHAIDINWQGNTERAFDVLSNPPGIGWWLAPVAELPVCWQHLWMLPWLLLAAWGAWRLGERFGGDGPAAAALLCTAPVALLAAHSLTPDLPLLALCTAGMAGFLCATDRGNQRSAAAWALVMGCAALFRYSGLALLPLLPLYALLRRRAPWSGLLAVLPMGLLLLHDLQAYGELHLLAMGRFQSVSGGGRDVFRKLVAALAMLGAAGMLPVLPVLGRYRALAGAALGAVLGLIGAWISGMRLGPSLWTGVCAAAGGAALTGVLLPGPSGEDRAERLFLAAWAFGGLLFLLGLRFTAARYWLPFLPAVWLAWLRLRPSRIWIGVALALQLAVAAGVAIDDLHQARAGTQLARWVQLRAQELDAQPGSFAGHWGWQHELEVLGWRALEDEERPPLGSLMAVAEAPWPQEPAEGTCLELLDELAIPDRWWGPRAHTAQGRANIHAFVVAGAPPVETYAPWTLANDARDRALLYRICER